MTERGHINRSAINVLLLRHERSSLPLGRELRSWRNNNTLIAERLI
ncbi:hypothetical protein PSY31_24230 [Shigella flexneri]|nr:hypothetical protein [Shigella flexneri]